MRDEQSHRLEILGEDGPPERRRPGEVDPHLGETVFPVPRVRVKAGVGIGPGFEQRAEHVDVSGLLQVLRARLRIVGLWRPLGLEGGEERRGAVRRSGKIWTRSALDEDERQVELAVERRHQEWAGAVRAHLIQGPRRRPARAIAASIWPSPGGVQ